MTEMKLKEIRFDEREKSYYHSSGSQDQRLPCNSYLEAFLTPTLLDCICFARALEDPKDLLQYLQSLPLRKSEKYIMDNAVQWGGA